MAAGAYGSEGSSFYDDDDDDSPLRVRDTTEVGQNEVMNMINRTVKDALHGDSDSMTIKVYRVWPVTPSHPSGQWYKTYPYNNLKDIEHLISGDFGRGRYRFEVWSEGRKCNDTQVTVGGGPALDTQGEQIPVHKSEAIPGDDQSSAFGPQGEVIHNGRGMSFSGNHFRGDPFGGMGTQMAATMDNMQRKEQEFLRKEYEWENERNKYRNQIRSLENKLSERDKKIYDLEIEKRGHEDIEERNRNLKDQLRKAQAETEAERQKIYTVELESTRLKAQVQAKELELRKIDEIKAELQRAKDLKEDSERRAYELRISNNMLSTQLENAKNETHRQVELAKAQVSSNQGPDPMMMMLLKSVIDGGGKGGMSEMMELMQGFRTLQETARDLAPEPAQAESGGANFGSILNGIGTVIGAAGQFVKPPQPQGMHPQQQTHPQQQMPPNAPRALTQGEPVARFENPQGQQAQPAPNEPHATRDFADLLVRGLEEFPSVEEWSERALPFLSRSGGEKLRVVADLSTLHSWASNVDGLNVDALAANLAVDPQKQEWLRQAIGALQGLLNRG